MGPDHGMRVLNSIGWGLTAVRERRDKDGLVHMMVGRLRSKCALNHQAGHFEYRYRSTGGTEFHDAGKGMML